MFYRPGDGGTSSQLLFTAGNIGTATTARWLFPGGGSGTAPTGATGPSFPVGRPGVLKNITFWWGAAGTAAPETVTFTVYVNGVATGIVLTRAVITTGVELLDTVGVSVVRGDLVSVRITRSGVLGSSPTDLYMTLGLYAP